MKRGSYVTSDQQVFSVKSDAKWHEHELQLDATIQAWGGAEMSATDLREAMLEAGWPLINALSEIIRHRAVVAAAAAEPDETPPSPEPVEEAHEAA